MKLLGMFLLFLGLSGLAFANDRICIRDYSKNDNGYNPCESGFPRYFEAIEHENPNEIVCALSHADRNCKTSPKEFHHVRDLDDNVWCVVNYHQPGVANYCAAHPEWYRWVTPAWN